MKNFFPGQYRPSDDDLTSLWKNATFVFDTNVLLNLYSYPESVRDIFLSVLEKICGRSWIPYQVALEFHRNRFARIKQSNSPLFKLRDRIRATSEELESEIKDIEFEKRNTGVGNLEERLLAVRQANSLLAEALDKACERLPKIGLDDPIANKISEFFGDHVGNPPSDQTALDAMIHDGNDRYDKNIPPGFKDAKDKKDIKYYDRDITYPAMFGDLIVWRQTIGHIQQSGVKNVIFVTGDRKEDWWQIVDKKTLGPSPDLVREFIEKSGAELFWMYTADQFLKYAETYLSAKEVTPETIEQVREISAQHESENKPSQYFFELKSADHYLPKFQRDEYEDKFLTGRNPYSYRSFNARNTHSYAEMKFAEWVQRHHKSDEIIFPTFPDLIVKTSEGVVGYEIFNASLDLKRLVRKVQSVSERANSVPFEITVVIILSENFSEDEKLDIFLADLNDVLVDGPIPRVLIGDFLMNEFNVRKVLRVPNK
jgi:hypothetical protein